MPKLVILWTDVVLWMSVCAVIAYILVVRRRAVQASQWARVFRSPTTMSAALVLAVFVVIALLDSVHYRVGLASPTGVVTYATRTDSLLDALLAKQRDSSEKTYSAPLAYRYFVKETVLVNHQPTRGYQRLKQGGAHLQDPEREWHGDVLRRLASGFLRGVIAAIAINLLLVVVIARPCRANLDQTFLATCRVISRGASTFPWRTIMLTISIFAILIAIVSTLADAYHVLGTDRTGNDVLYQALKSIRTAIVMGTLTTLATLPFALVLGILAGYCKGWVDDAIQYLYTTLSSIPNVLLIAACVLMLQVFIDQNTQRFPTSLERADLRLFWLCVILGVTGWANLCRLLRGETLKLRELDFVQAATAFGVSHTRIMLRHILPNVMHVVLISLVLEFSAIVLYEAVLSYVGVGVDPQTNSFGTMINLARAEIERDPLVWWNLATAFTLMLAVVLAANLFADGVRAAFDPRHRSFIAGMNPEIR